MKLTITTNGGKELDRIDAFEETKLRSRPVCDALIGRFQRAVATGLPIDMEQPAAVVGPTGTGVATGASLPPADEPEDAVQVCMDLVGFRQAILERALPADAKAIEGLFRRAEKVVRRHKKP